MFKFSLKNKFFHLLQEKEFLSSMTHYLKLRKQQSFKYNVVYYFLQSKLKQNVKMLYIINMLALHL